jgi:hypothetical protein
MANSPTALMLSSHRIFFAAMLVHMGSNRFFTGRPARAVTPPGSYSAPDWASGAAMQWSSGSVPSSADWAKFIMKLMKADPPPLACVVVCRPGAALTSESSSARRAARGAACGASGGN